MDYAAIDLHKNESQIRILADGGGDPIDMRIPTRRDRLTAVFGGRSRLRVLVEASTESEWVAQHLETLGHEVIVADPSYALMYGHRSRHIKTDRRDVAALAAACQHGIYRATHRRSEPQRQVQWHLNLRRDLVDARTRLISGVRAITRSGGYRVRGGASDTFRSRLAALELPVTMTDACAPVNAVLAVLDAEIARVDDAVAARVADAPVVRRLTTLPGIGPITACAYVAALDNCQRFDGRRGAAQVTSYLGLVPREHSSGEHRQRGQIIRSAHPYVQSLLVQAAWRVRRSADPRTVALRTWAQAIERRRGKKIAVVALARRLARILYAMWREETDYQPTRLRTRPPATVKARQSA